MDPIPSRQAAVLQFLVDCQEKQGVVPSIGEIGEHFGFSQSNAVRLLDKLEARGAIERPAGSRRSIRILRRAGRPNQLPLIGRIAAGAPLTAGEHVAEYIDVSPLLFNPAANLLFRVEGESMINAGIRPDDLVGVHLQNEFRNGQIVAALIIHPKTDDPELTLKSYRRRGSIITLLSENDDQDRYAPMSFELGKDSIQIVGLYCGLVRTRPQ